MIDTNVLVSALLSGSSLPAHLVVLWRQRQFDLLTSGEQLDELRRFTRYPKIHERLSPAIAGRLINDLGEIAIRIDPIPLVAVCADPFDNYLLAMAAGCGADFLVTGDKRDLLALGAYERTRIVTVRDFLIASRRLPRDEDTIR